MEVEIDKGLIGCLFCLCNKVVWNELGIYQKSDLASIE